MKSLLLDDHRYTETVTKESFKPIDVCLRFETLEEAQAFKGLCAYNVTIPKLVEDSKAVWAPGTDKSRMMYTLLTEVNERLAEALHPRTAPSVGAP